MKILYLSCHEILEYDELKLLTQIGHEVYSLGAYTMPGGDENRKRPGLKLPYNPHFIELATRYSKEELHPEMLEGIGAVIIMHVPTWIEKNWPIFKEFINGGGRVIWRSIGQSVPHVERRLQPFRAQGLEVIRYSPAEETISDYIGSDAMIRFAKDPQEYAGYTGEVERAINFTQSMRQRAQFCGYEILTEVLTGFPYTIFGPGNEDIKDSGGLLSYSDQIKAMQENRLYFYHGTYPASYTLSFIEAWMTGMPVVAVGGKYGNGRDFPSQATYEVDSIITNEVDGFVSDDPVMLKSYVLSLLKKPELAKKIGEAGRARAISLFSDDVIRPLWEKFLS